MIDEFSIYILSNEFFEDYPPSAYPELLTKQERPYTCLIIKTRSGYHICIPYRTEMRHNNGFRFKKTKRSEKHKSGLDFSKLVLIREESADRYLRDHAVVDKDEYKAVVDNIEKIASKVEAYISVYANHLIGNKAVDARRFAKHYQFSTLPYFHDILGL